MGETAGAHDAALVHDRGENVAGGFGLQNHPSAVGLYRTAVADGRAERFPVDPGHVIQHLAAEGVMDEAVPHQIDRECPSGAEDDGAEIGDDHSLVCNSRGDEKGKPVIGHLDRALIDHRAQALQRILREEIPTGHEIFVADLQSRGQEAADVDLGAGAEENAVRIQEEQAAVRLQSAEDYGGIRADDPVQGNRTR